MTNTCEGHPGTPRREACRVEAVELVKAYNPFERRFGQVVSNPFARRFGQVVGVPCPEADTGEPKVHE